MTLTKLNERLNESCNPDAFFSANHRFSKCVFPTRYVAREGGAVLPTYPLVLNETTGEWKSRFDPRVQQMTSLGISQVIEAVSSGKDELRSIDGFTESRIDGVVGLALKPIDRTFILIDFDVHLFDNDAFPPAIIAWIEKFSENAIAIRGNRKRLTLVMGQHQSLKDYFDENFPGKNKIVASQGMGSIEIGIREGSSANLWGLHKSRKTYQVSFPEKLNGLTATGFEKFRAIIEDSNFRFPVTCNAADRIEVEEIFEHCRLMIGRDVERLISQTQRLRGHLSDVSLFQMLPLTTQEIVNAKFIPDGTRRNKVWRVTTDLATIVHFCKVHEIPFNQREVTAILRRLSNAIQKDQRTVTYWIESGEYKRVDKWSFDHISESCYAEAENDLTMSEEYCNSFMYAIKLQLSSILQEFIDKERTRRGLVTA